MIDVKEMLSIAYKAIDDKFGQNTNILDISKISVMADYFVITTAGNRVQLKAIADELMEKMQKNGVPLLHSEGYQSSDWVLLNFNYLIIHIFTKDAREFYSLERVWNDATVVENI